MNIELTEQEICTILKCIKLEYQISEFTRGFGKQTSDEKDLKDLWQKINKMVTREI